jgi:hypothetical protein
MRFPPLFLICRFLRPTDLSKRSASAVRLRPVCWTGKNNQAAKIRSAGGRSRNISIVQPSTENYFPGGLARSIAIELLIAQMSRVGSTTSVKTVQR